MDIQRTEPKTTQDLYEKVDRKLSSLKRRDAKLAQQGYSLESQERTCLSGQRQALLVVRARLVDEFGGRSM